MKKDSDFESLLEQYKPLILGQIKKLNIHKNYDEFYHVGMIGLWEAYARFDEEKGSFATYAYFYVRGRMLSFLKQQSRYDANNYVTEHISKLSPAIVHDEVDVDVHDLLQQHLHTLTDREKQWVIEELVLGKTTKEIASQYGVSVSTVKTWRRLALKKLRTTELRNDLLR